LYRRFDSEDYSKCDIEFGAKIIGNVVMSWDVQDNFSDKERPEIRLREVQL